MSDKIYLHGQKAPRLPKLEPLQTFEQWKAEKDRKKADRKTAENDCPEIVQPLEPA